MHRRRTEGRGGLNEVLNQPVAILYLVSYLEKSEKMRIGRYSCNLADHLNVHLRIYLIKPMSLMHI